MWWEWAIVVSVVGGAAVWLVLRFRRATTGRSDCDCGCQGACAAVDSLSRTLDASGVGDGGDRAERASDAAGSPPSGDAN